MARRFGYISHFLALVSLCASTMAAATEFHGQVTFGGFPVPGATITATQGTKKLTTVSDQGGVYNFPDLPDGNWNIKVEMQCFSVAQDDVTVVPNMPAGKWELTLLPIDQLLARSKLVQAPIISLPVLVARPVEKRPKDRTLPPQPRRCRSRPRSKANSPPMAFWSTAASITRPPVNTRLIRRLETEGPTARASTTGDSPPSLITPH